MNNISASQLKKFCFGTINSLVGKRTVKVEYVVFVEHFTGKTKKELRYVICDIDSEIQIGDKVYVYHSKPISKTKKFVAQKIN